MATVLGLPGAWADDPAERATHYTTKAGGLPDWALGTQALVSDEQLSCKACGQRLGLVVQAYAPLYIEGREVSERSLYVFGCLASDCGYNQDSWRVFRVQGQDAGVKLPEQTATGAELDTRTDNDARDPTASESWWQDTSWSGGAENGPSGSQKQEQGESEIGSKVNVGTSLRAEKALSEQNASVKSPANDPQSGFQSDVRESEATVREAGASAHLDEWTVDDSWGASTSQSTGPDALDMSALSEAIAQVADSANKKAPQSRATSADSGESERRNVERRDSDASMLPCFYIVAGEEQLEGTKEKVVKAAVDECPKDETWEGEGYEYDSAVSADRTFLHFRKRLEKAPEQCIRYGFQSMPLLARALSEPPPDCPACGAPRTFEMQLMPPLPYFFAEASEEAAAHVAGWEWLTLLVYTCSKACHKAGSSSHVAVQEFLVYQHELEKSKGQQRGPLR